MTVSGARPSSRYLCVKRSDMRHFGLPNETFTRSDRHRFRGRPAGSCRRCPNNCYSESLPSPRNIVCQNHKKISNNNLGERNMSEITASKIAVPRTFAENGLTKEQKRNLVLASLGSLLEFYEFMVFGFFTVVIGKLFFPPDLPEAVKIIHSFAHYSL